MAHVLGKACKFYRNTGSYGSPTWTEVDVVKDVELDIQADEIDVSTRGGGGFKEYDAGLIDATIKVTALYDPADTHIDALRTAFFAGTVVEVFIADGASATAGTEGLRAHCKIMSWPRNEQLAEAVMIEFTMKPTPNANAAPTWYVVGA